MIIYQIPSEILDDAFNQARVYVYLISITVTLLWRLVFWSGPWQIWRHLRAVSDILAKATSVNDFLSDRWTDHTKSFKPLMSIEKFGYTRTRRNEMQDGLLSSKWITALRGLTYMQSNTRCVSACIEHVTYMERQMDKQTGRKGSQNVGWSFFSV